MVVVAGASPVSAPCDTGAAMALKVTRDRQTMSALSVRRGEPRPFGTRLRFVETTGDQQQLAGRGLFVEHEGTAEHEVRRQIAASLRDVCNISSATPSRSPASRQAT